MNGRGVGWIGCMLVLMIVMLTGCDNGTKVDLKAVDAPLRDMTERYNAYIKADKTLPDVEKDIQLRTSALIIKVLDTAAKKVSGVETTGNGNVIVQGTLLNQSYTETVALTGITRAYQYEDASKCQKEGTCSNAIVSTSDLARKGLYFQSKLEMDTYLQGRKKKLSDPKDVIIYEHKARTQDDLTNGLDAGDRLFNKYATKL